MIIMFNIKFVSLALFLFCSSFLTAQSNQLSDKKEIQTEEFKVSGLCAMCKDRIENAALIKGVKLAEWNKDNGNLKVVFRADKISLDSIQVEIAKAGHDTPLHKATEEAYRKLPDCCAYRDGVQKH